MNTRQAEPQTSHSPKRSVDHPRITIVGYGDGGGREHARRLRERGHDVQVAMLPGGMSWVRAMRDGFRPMRATEAVLDADIIVLVVPQDEVEILYWEEIAPLAATGAMVVFTDEIDLDTDRLPDGVDVAVTTMHGDRCLVSIRQDGTGKARERALAYLQWLGTDVPMAPPSRTRVADDSDPFPHPSRRVL
jgi:ketol-acid reductoisomerase